MRKNKKLLLGGLSVLTLVAAGSGAVSTFAWYVATEGVNTLSSKVASGIDAAANPYTQGRLEIVPSITVTGTPCLSDSSGDVYYYNGSATEANLVKDTTRSRDASYTTGTVSVDLTVYKYTQATGKALDGKEYFSYAAMSGYTKETVTVGTTDVSSFFTREDVTTGHADDLKPLNGIYKVTLTPSASSCIVIGADASGVYAATKEAAYEGITFSVVAGVLKVGDTDTNWTSQSCKFGFRGEASNQNSLTDANGTITAQVAVRS